MKYKKHDHWNNAGKQEGLLFFAQILDEALFDYTLETFKPHALNVRLLCIEALETLDGIKAGLLKKPNIDGIIDELKWSLTTDKCAKYILGSKLDPIIARINASLNNLNELRNSILFLYHFFDGRKYLNELKELLINLIPVNKEKEKIYFLTKSLLTELINYGYSPGYLYFTTNNYFFNRSINFHHTTPEDFFKYFNFVEKQYIVVFKVSKLFDEFKKVGTTLGFKILSEYKNPLIKPNEKRFIENVNDGQTLIVFENIEGLDDNNARIVAEYSLDQVANLFSFYHHKETPKIDNEALVINITDKTCLVRERPIKSIIKRADIEPTIAANNVEKLLQKLVLESGTTKTLSRAIALHSNALVTDQIENKLLSLWTAIETLIPKDIDSGIDRVVQIINALTPFQTYAYITRLVNEVCTDFWFYDTQEAQKIIKKKNKYDSFCEFLVTSENESCREAAYKKIFSPLLRWRLFYLSSKLSNTKSIKKVIVDHQRKVEWQIQRIYRVRNLIVHSGKMPSFANILVENLHNYFDSFLNYFIENAIRENRIRTISEAIINCQMEVSMLKDTIDELGESEVNLANYKRIFSL